MLFNSWQFAVFLPVVFLLYWGVSSQKFRIYLLLISSYYFYMSWNVKYIVLILFTTLISYLCAIIIERHEKYKRIALWSSLISCLGVLFIFKYFNFFNSNLINFLNSFALNLHPVTLKLMLPVGISFYTFQTLSYVIDVYNKKIKAEKNFAVYAAFISFFPQLVAGPIERAENLLPQIKYKHEFNYEQASYGLKLIAWGLYKKLVIADNLAMYADPVFENLYGYRGFSLIVAALFFTVQIYCDFSGYSDIARGSAKLMGINLIENFRAPYFASSLREFWSRWHISLSTWFRDYLYIPLGGNRVSKLRHNFNLLITFLISGLWHGADWTFIIWGGLHGLGQIIENLFRVKRDAKQNILVRFLKIIFVFMFAAALWVFFRAQSLSDAVYVFAHMFDGINDFRVYIRSGLDAIPGAKKFYLSLTVFLVIYDFIFALKDKEPLELLSKHNIFVRWSLYIALGFIVVFFSQKGIGAEFVYFQF